MAFYIVTLLVGVFFIIMNVNGHWIFKFFIRVLGLYLTVISILEILALLNISLI